MSRWRAGVLTSAPWRRAPLLLARRPSVFAAILGAAAILAITAASGVLFLSTLGTASLRAQAADDCPESSLPSVSASMSGDGLARANAAGATALRASGLPAPYVADLGLVRIQSSTAHLFSRPGALDHVQVLSGSGPGVWFPDDFARQLGVRAGERLRVGSGEQLRVAGTYRTLAPSPFQLANLPRYWCSWSAQIVPTAASDSAIAATPVAFRHGPWLITDPGTLARLSDTPVVVSWYSTLPGSASLGDYVAAQRDADAAAASMAATLSPSAEAGAKLPLKLDIAEHARDGISGSIVPIDVAGILVALLLVAGAGVFWATHRAREVRLLVARGVGPAALGVKAVLETALPALLGTAVGYVAAIALVRAVGPSETFEPGAVGDGLAVSVGALILGLALVGRIGARSGRDAPPARSPRRRARRVPWELALLGLAAWLAVLVHRDAAVTVDHTIVRVNPLTFVFPILGAVAVLLFAGRLVAWGLPAVGRGARRAGSGGYLALRRVAGSPVIVVGLIIGTALPCCLLTYGATVTHGVDHEVTTKYRTNLGAEHVLAVIGLHDTIPDAEGHGAFVATYPSDPVLADGTDAYVLGVQPATFGEFALLTSSQRADLGKLRPVGGSGPLPAILVNAPAAAGASSVSIGDTVLPLDVVARTAIFPGLRNSSRPMIVVDSSALGHVDPDADRENQMWTSTSQLDAALALLDRDGYRVLTEITSDVVIGTTGLLPVTWIFGYLRALAILIGVIAVAGLAFALAARTRRRTVSYVLSRRMGMSKLAHLRSLLIELGLVVGVGWLAGAGIGAGAFGVIYRSLDVYPALPPPMAFVLPAATLAATAAITAAVITLAALATHALAERANPAEILRLE